MLVRIVTKPQDAKGERLAIYVDSRTVSDPTVLVYSITRDEWRTEHHRRLMWKSRRASPTESAEAKETLAQIGESVRVLQSDKQRGRDRSDEVPADPEDD